MLHERTTCSNRPSTGIAVLTMGLILAELQQRQREEKKKFMHQHIPGKKVQRLAFMHLNHCFEMVKKEVS